MSAHTIFVSPIERTFDDSWMDLIDGNDMPFLNFQFKPDPKYGSYSNDQPKQFANQFSNLYEIPYKAYRMNNIGDHKMFPTPETTPIPTVPYNNNNQQTNKLLMQQPKNQSLKEQINKSVYYHGPDSARYPDYLPFRYGKYGYDALNYNSKTCRLPSNG